MRMFSASALTILVLGMGCAPSTAPVADAPARSAPSRTLVTVTRLEPASLSLKEIPVVQGAGDGPARAPFNAGLAIVDGSSRIQPYLAAALPELNTDSWTVFPDGRMETAYRLRPNLNWHDGRAFTGADFVFASRVYSTREFGHATAIPQSEIEEVTSPDPSTVVVRWKRPYPDAGKLEATLFPPLPAHILEEPFQRLGMEPFPSHPYWTTEYVGAGPYRLESWEPGAFLEAVAFDGYALGRPKIERLRLRFVADSNTVLANLLAGEAHLTFPFAISSEQGAVLRAQWGGTYIANPSTWRRVEFQNRPDYVTPKALQDVRVRKALAHAVDRETLNEVVYLGESLVMDTMITPTVSYFPAVERAIARYPFDVRRAQQLLVDAGLMRGPDGAWVSPTEGRLTIEAKANATVSFQNELAIIASGFRDAGMDTKESWVPIALIRDGETRGSFQGLYVIQGGEGEAALRSYVTRAISRPENGWVGSNRGGYSNPEFDRRMDVLSTTLDGASREQQIVDLARLLSEDLPAISLVFGASVVAADRSLYGPAIWGYQGDVTWNMHQWEWR